MDYSRVETAKLKADVDAARQLIEQAEKLLRPHLRPLTDADRRTIPKPRDGYEEGCRAMALAATDFPELAALSGFSAEAVVEDLDNAAALAGISERLENLSQLIIDTRHAWLAEAWVPSLAAYAIAKVKGKTDGRMRALIEPLARVFAVVRRRDEKA